MAGGDKRLLAWPQERRPREPHKQDGSPRSWLTSDTRGCRLAGDTVWAEDVGPSEHHGLRGQREDGAEGLKVPQCQGLCSVYIKPLDNELGQQQDPDRGL